jgi:hypothetical protein
MKPRLNPFAAASAPMQSWLDFGKTILQSGLEDSLIVAINGWNRLQVGFRGVHPVEERQAA